MNQPRTWTFVDETFVPEAVLPVTDRGVRYGMSVFETIAVRAGEPLFIQEHLQRLAEACRAAEFIFPEKLSEIAIRALLTETTDSVLRIYVSAGDGHPSAPVTASRTFLMLEETTFPSELELAHGWRVILSRVPFPAILGGWKTGNYWSSVQALQEAKREGGQEAIVLNAQGAVISASMGNVFFVKQGRLITPPLIMGARDGVLRSWVMQQSVVEEELLSVDDLGEMEECFITNSRIGVMPVSTLAESLLPSREHGLKLSLLYRESIFIAR